MNDSNETIVYCSIDNPLHEMNSVLNCYGQFAKENILATMLEIGLGLGTVVANILLFYMIYYKEDKKFVFDKIYMAHAIVDFIVGGIDLPIYHIFTILNYWPFSMIVCILWNTLDSSLNTVTILHMLFMSWVRMQSIRDPKGYLENPLVKSPFVVTGVIWLIGIGIWFPINYFYITVDYQYGQCYIPYRPEVMQFVLTMLTWFLPLIMIVLITIYIMRVLYIKQKNKKKMGLKKTEFTNLNSSTLTVNKTLEAINSSTEATAMPAIRRKEKVARKKFKLDAQSKMSIIILVYLVQWVPSCFLWMIQSLCNCVPMTLSTITYWLTFTVAFTDPILVMLLNPNYSPSNLHINKSLTKSTSTNI